MKVTVTTLTDNIFTIEVSEDMELENFKALCEFECGIPTNEMALVWNGRTLSDGQKKLNEYGIKEGEMLLVQRVQGAQGQASQDAPSSSSGGMPMIDFSGINIPGTSSGPPAAQGARSSDDPATLRQMLLNSPHDIAILKERNPPLAEALLSGSLDKFKEVLAKQQGERADRERDRIRLLTADPFDAVAQQKIAEEIRLKNVESNMETAMEYAPESFGQVVMLYVDSKVNGHDVKAFVDSGAQMTFMSRAAAERCNIMRLVDTRWAGIAKGVGTQKIIGRIHLCQIQIGRDFLQCSFSILEDQPMDMLLGLDMLKRHQCCIDLKNNQLSIGTTGTTAPFLAEGDLPEHARLNRQLSETSTGPDEDRQLAEAMNRSAQESGTVSPSSLHTITSASQHQPISEESVQAIMNQGFSRQQAVTELQSHNGNLDEALVALLAKSFQLP